jgi:hypothetical protein
MPIVKSSITRHHAAIKTMSQRNTLGKKSQIGKCSPIFTVIVQIGRLEPRRVPATWSPMNVAMKK